MCARGHLGMDATAIGRFRSMDGFVEVTQGLLVDSSLSRVGRAWYTCAGNALFGLGYALIAAVSTSMSVYLFVRQGQASRLQAKMIDSTMILTKSLVYWSVGAKTMAAAGVACIVHALQAGHRCRSNLVRHQLTCVEFRQTDDPEHLFGSVKHAVAAGVGEVSWMNE